MRLRRAAATGCFYCGGYRPQARRLGQPPPPPDPAPGIRAKAGGTPTSPFEEAVVRWPAARQHTPVCVATPLPETCRRASSCCPSTLCMSPQSNRDHSSSDAPESAGESQTAALPALHRPSPAHRLIVPACIREA
eukprot:scaffold3436_cov129-Isochrysis_galbana.AAC.4